MTEKQINGCLGTEVEEGQVTRGHKETLGDNRNVCGHDLNMYSLLYINHISIKVENFFCMSSF